MSKITKACTPTLPPSEVNELCRRYASGDNEALDLLVSSHVAFVTSMASRYGSLGVPVEDLISEGVLGLIEAVKRFEPERGNRFLTYAVFWIRRHILDSLRRDSQPIRRPRRTATRGDSSVVLRTQQPSRTVTLGEARLRGPSETPMHFQSLDHSKGDSNEPALSERLEDTSSKCPEEGLLRDDTRRVVWSAMEGLRPNQRMVVALRHGLCDDERWTLRQVGALMGVSRERVRQIEMQAVEQLRRGLRRVCAPPIHTRTLRADAPQRPRSPVHVSHTRWPGRRTAPSAHAAGGRALGQQRSASR